MAMTTDHGELQVSKLVGKTIKGAEYINEPLPDGRGGSRDRVTLQFEDGTQCVFKIGSWSMGRPPGAPLNIAIDVVVLDENNKLI